MKLTLSLDFESIQEMQDWIVREAALLQVTADVAAYKKTVELKEKLESEPEPAAETKPVKAKRKRRTKAEMAAVRAAEKALLDAEPTPPVEDPTPEPSVEDPTPEPSVEDPTPEPPATPKANGDLMRAFQELLGNRDTANQAILVLDRVAASLPEGVQRQFSSPVRFSELPEDAQVVVIEDVRALL